MLFTLPQLNIEVIYWAYFSLRCSLRLANPAWLNGKMVLRCCNEPTGASKERTARSVISAITRAPTPCLTLQALNHKRRDQFSVAATIVSIPSGWTVRKSRISTEILSFQVFSRFNRFYEPLPASDNKTWVLLATTLALPKGMATYSASALPHGKNGRVSCVLRR